MKTLYCLISLLALIGLDSLADTRATTEEVVGKNLNGSTLRCFYRLPLGANELAARSHLNTYYQNDHDFALTMITRGHIKLIGFAHGSVKLGDNLFHRSGTTTIHIHVKLIDDRVVGVKYFYWFAPLSVSAPTIKYQKTRGDY